ncbi:hypothetical protein SAMN05428949_1243 [Chitinophaga sp. YR627]|nr:hypothetical protein SAMN05428949_1243 [Chitinophaga sp. YR627]
MKYISIIFTLLMVSCSLSKSPITGAPSYAQFEDTSAVYKIYKIDSINSWYVIYARNSGYRYKIISKKCTQLQGVKIMKHKSYNLRLISTRHYPNAPTNYLDVPCFMLDEQTSMCLEPRKEIYDVHYTKDLKGLYFSR